jgi:Lon protease-like protein
MGRSGFDPSFEDLPAELPIFPLPGVLLLPGGRLPLNIFEPRYLAMTRAALAGPRLIGMIQPSQEAPDVGAARTFPVGCAGRIVAFSETDDGRYLLTLAGLARFRIAAELQLSPEGFRRVRPDFAPFRADLEQPAGEPVDRPVLVAALKRYFELHGLTADWEAIEKAPDERLVTSLAMLCPFAPAEKQVLLEAPTLGARAQAMIAILRMGAHEPGSEARPN